MVNYIHVHLYTSKQVDKVKENIMKISEKKNGETARDYAFRVIKENIVSLEFTPGTFVSENEMALELGLSRTPVREAIIDLAKASVIETVPQRGNYVTLINPDMVEESRFLRQVLDRAVIEVACNTDDAEGIAALEENVQLQEFYLDKNAGDKIFVLDNQFHEGIYRLARKSSIFEMRSTLMIHFDRVRSLSVETVKDMKIVKDHREMLEAIKSHDVATAVQLVDKHMNRYQVDQDIIRAQYPEYFIPAKKS